MSVFLKTEIEIKEGQEAALKTLIQDFLIPIMNGYGWQLEQSLVDDARSPGNVYNVWRIPDQKAFDDGVNALRHHEDYPKTRELREIAIVQEKMTLTAEFIDCQ